MSHHERGLVRSQKQHGPRDLGSISDAPDGMQLHDVLFDLGILKPAFKQGRARHTGANGVDANALSDVVQRGCLGQADDPCFEAQ
jgi:hypothetical protein